MRYTYSAELRRVVDGDTLVFELDCGFNLFRRTTIRLLGIDTAETYGVSHDSAEYQTGMKHKEFVEDWLNQANSLTVRTDEKGKFGRWLGEVFNEDNESLNDRLVDEFDVVYE